MTEEEFQKHIAALATRRMEQPKKLSAQHLKYWGEIISEQYNFDRGKDSKIAKILHNIYDTIRQRDGRADLCILLYSGIS